MQYLYNFNNEESGAVTVDWVVLTAAIVGIGMSVIAAVSVGVESASEEIDGGLQAASAFTFSFGGTATAGTMSGYFEEFGNDLESLYTAINDDAPDGYGFVGVIDTATDTPIYADSLSESGNLSIRACCV